MARRSKQVYCTIISWISLFALRTSSCRCWCLLSRGPFFFSTFSGGLLPAFLSNWIHAWKKTVIRILYYIFCFNTVLKCISLCSSDIGSSTSISSSLISFTNTALESKLHTPAWLFNFARPMNSISNDSIFKPIAVRFCTNYFVQPMFDICLSLFRQTPAQNMPILRNITLNFR